MPNMTDLAGGQELPELLHPGSRSLFRHWERIRGERSAPDRGDVDLRSISGILPAVGVLERRRRPTTFLWRIAGSHIGDIWGSEVTGQDLLSGWKGMERHSLASCLDAVVDAHQPFVARFSAIAEHGEAVGVELLALPVKSRDGQSTQILCAAQSFREPQWLSSRLRRRLELSSVRVIWTEPVPGPGSHAERDASEPGRVTASPLRVIRGGRPE